VCDDKRRSRAALNRAGLLNGFLSFRTPPDKVDDDFTPSSSDEILPNTIWLIACAFLAFPFSLAFLLLSEITWKSEGAERGPNESLLFLPSIYMVLTNTIQLSMWRAAFCLRIRGFFTGGFRFCNWLSKLWTPRPPERIDRGRPKGPNKAEQRK
jgi:hypothetical protein